ncbi:uncharacterized protein LOC105429713 [Pogonomyrmex barbatus]|uniref:Uncharacterized protein LOC105429713 n=1 Tax=Pogonomyrmex barbatus TaxID=144034 RepID=A0A6I9X948_9HYME|nr:uncharacterized protein LOC105429713 [Pogonomyrmex barbatus]
MFHTSEFQKSDNEMISKIIDNLGLDDARYEITERNDNFMSTMYLLRVKFKNRTKGQTEELPIIVKRPSQVEYFRQLSRSESQFHNEILFYRTYAEPNDNFARCLYTDERPPADSVIALENMNKQGYRSCPYKYNVPLEYTLAAVRELGRFHGKGYVMKELRREKFFAIVEQLREPRYDKMIPDDNVAYINLTSTRAVEYLRKHDYYDATFCNKAEAVLSNAFDEVMIKTVEPREPLSTMCHGDFTASNILFKTDNDGRQHQPMLIDFALLRYATPVVDLSTYLCLCCSNEVRRDKFPEIMRAYHDALKKYLSEADIWDAEKYSYEALLDDFRRGGLFGFVITTSFLPVLMGYEDPEDFPSTGLIKAANLNKQLGGDEISKIVADMLLHLRDLGCFEYFSESKNITS